MAADLERYKKHDMRSHIYEIPGMWVGSTDLTQLETFVYSEAEGRMVKRTLAYVPALLKIIDEILTNATDQAMRAKTDLAAGKADVRLVKNIRVNVDRETGYIEVMNDGDSIDVEIHPTYNIYIPSMIFGQFLTSANYDQGEERLVGGVHGIGAKATSVFSKEFIVDLVDHRHKRHFTQRWSDNMKVADKAKVTASSKAPYTKIRFLPDYERFGQAGLTDDTFELIRKRTMDACACTDPTVAVYFNDKKVEVKDFERYADLFLGPKDEHPRVYEACNERWEVVASFSDTGGFEQQSWVNGVATIYGGKHVEQITNQIVKRLGEMIQSKKKKEVKAQHIKDNLMVFVKCYIVNPSFSSQTKEMLTTPVAKFGSKCELSDRFMDRLYKTGIVDKIVAIADFHENKKLSKTDGKKTTRVLVPKLEDAIRAGTKDSHLCTLILTEGDSAKSCAIAGLSVIGREYYGVFPLRGKVMNVKDAQAAKISQNEEISNLKKILGLEHGKDYKDLSSLRYGRIMVLADQDLDGQHIKGLIFNLFQSLYPSLFRTENFLTSMLTPIIKATHGTGANAREIAFYNFTDYEKWKETTDQRGWRIKYYKGLGTSTETEAKEYFRRMNAVVYTFTGRESEEAIDLAFNKKRADDRKDWLMRYDRNELLDYKDPNVPYEEFVHKELIHYSNYDLERSIPSIADGLKVSTRKILYGCLKRRLYKDEIRVAQLAGYISEVSAYHHGEASLQQAIIGMAQTFVGANNINLLAPNGQFGSRIMGGSDAASPRYIHTLLTPLARAIFREEDAPILEYLDDDGLPIEPSYYIPVIPMVLVNGSIGIGTGFSTNVPSHNPSDIIGLCQAVVRALDDGIGMIDSADDLSRAYDAIMSLQLPTPQPWQMGYKGAIVPGKEGTYVSKGVYRWLDETTCEITELPLYTWSDDYKEMLVGMLQEGSRYLKDFQPYYTALNVRFVLKLHPGAREALGDKFEQEFKLSSSKNLSLNNIHLYNPQGTIRRYRSVVEVFQEWACVRIARYQDRKAHQLREMEREHRVLSAKCRFIQEIVSGVLKVMNKKQAEVVEQLAARNYPKLDQPAAAEEGGATAGIAAGGYNYLVRMPIYHLTLEKKQALEKEAEDLERAIAALREKPIQRIWAEELKEIEGAWEKHRDQILAEYEEDRQSMRTAGTTKPAKRAAAKK